MAGCSGEILGRTQRDKRIAPSLYVYPDKRVTNMPHSAIMGHIFSFQRRNPFAQQHQPQVPRDGSHQAHRGRTHHRYPHRALRARAHPGRRCARRCLRPCTEGCCADPRLRPRHERDGAAHRRLRRGTQAHRTALHRRDLPRIGRRRRFLVRLPLDASPRRRRCDRRTAERYRRGRSQPHSQGR